MGEPRSVKFRGRKAMVYTWRRADISGAALWRECESSTRFAENVMREIWRLDRVDLLAYDRPAHWINFNVMRYY